MLPKGSIYAFYEARDFEGYRYELITSTLSNYFFFKYDIDILEQARKDDRVCITLDADFHALLATSGERGSSVVRVRKEGIDAGKLAELLQAVWPSIRSALADGAMVTVTERAIRVRRLPIIKG